MKLKKSLLSLALSASMLIFSACGQGGEDPASADETSAAVSQNISDEAEAGGTATEGAGFQVKGTSLYDAKGNEFIMRGINHAHSWFQDKLETAVPAIAKTGANTVRVVLSDGQQWERIPLEDVEKIIEICKENKLVCILEVHDLTGKDDTEGLRKVSEYWLDIKSALIGNEAYVILNIANEWVGSWDDADMWYQGYSEAIKTLRGGGIKNTLMIDAPGWGQFAKPIDQYGEALFNEDPDKNVMFSIHMYGAAGKSPRIISSNLEYATNHGLCAVVGEFGYNHSDGDVDEEYIMEYCTEKGIGYLGWSWKGNGGGVEYLDIAEDWDGNVLSADWGDRLINGENGIRETSKLCSVFE
ncbi:MAG: glycoside hydrolase family 5 protein [Bacteroides sp.]|nr:glycoside hydrolase family 5 protein [Bacteroides sp.]